MSLHICFLSDQLLANYLPVKYDQPKKVFYIASEYVEKKGLHTTFEKMIKDLNKAEDLNIEIIKAKNMVPSGGFNALYEYFLNIPEEIKQLNVTDITLNITGGNKLMTLAAYDLLGSEVNRVIYTNTQASQIEILDESTSPVKLQSLLNIDEYLTAYSIAPKSYNNQNDEWCEKVEARKGLTKNIADFFADENNRSFLSSLNWLANEFIKANEVIGVNGLINQEKTFNYDNMYARNAEVLRLFVDQGLIGYDNKKTIRFNSIEDAQYLGGFWLEEYVYHIAKDAGVDDVRCGQAIQSSKKNRNEIDIVIVHNNRLLLIECKTSVHGKYDMKDNQIVYKLDSIAEDLKGLYGKALIVSINDLTDAAKEKAKVQKIDVISGNKVKKLKEIITDWMNGKQII